MEKHWDLLAEKMAEKSLGEIVTVKKDALDKLMSGQGTGDLLGGITMGINFL